jgi:hypothetical protein
MRLISWALQSGSEQFILTGKLERRTQIWIKETGGSTTEWTRGTLEKMIYIYREGI